MSNQINLNPVENLLETFFNGSISDFLGRDFTNNLPSANIEELGDQYIIHLAAPGLTKSDFTIKVENNKISISASKEKSEEEGTIAYKRREYDYSKFSRTFTISESVDKSKIDATYNDGILSIFLPKKEEAKSDEQIIVDVK